MKKNLKKFSILLFALMMVIGSVIPIKALDGNDYSDPMKDFNLALYRADYYLNKNNPANKNLEFQLTSDHPSHVIVDSLNHNVWFQISVGAWEAKNIVTDPSEVTDKLLDKKGYYEAIIFSVFIAQQDNKDYITDICSKISSENNKLFSNMEKWVAASDEIDIKNIRTTEIKTLTAIDKSLVKDYISTEIIKMHPMLDGASTISGWVDTFFSTANTIEDAVYNLLSYIKLTEISKGMKATLKELYKNCPDSKPLLKDALWEASKATEDIETAVSIEIFSAGTDAVGNVVGSALSGIWNHIISKCPYSSFFTAGANIGTMISNKLFSTDKTIEQYEKMKCLDEFIDLFSDTVHGMGDKYLASRTTENAENFFASIDAYQSVLNLSCDFASEYADVLYNDASIGWLAISRQNYNEYCNSVSNTKKYINSSFEGLIEEYKYSLKEDYPDIYNILFPPTQGITPRPVSGISFEKKSITIGTKDILPSVPEPVIVPENADNKRVIYTSSDNSILSIHSSSGVCHGNKPGSVTVTAQTVDGGYTANITVNVVEGNGNESGVSSSSVKDSGQCGDNVYWTLYDNGTLYINGTGKMTNYVSLSRKTPFYNMPIDKVIIAEGVTSIGNQAFEDCESLTSITIPNSVTTIGSGAFWNCKSLTSITIPDSVTSIGSYAFYNCQNLKSIAIPKSVTFIEYELFNGCKSLTSITIPNSVTSIGSHAFLSCDSLTSITIPDSVTRIGSYAFRGCQNLANITIPNGVTSIESSTFSGCQSLTNITIPNSVTRIGSYAFSGCIGLTSITVPNSVTSVGSYAFSGCKGLINITIPNSVTTIEDSVFNNCTSLTNITIPNSVTSIGSKAFYQCESLKNIIIPNSVTIIGESAFWDCTSLTSITIPNSVTSVGNYAFFECKSLKKITIPNSIISIGNQAFTGCTSLTSITIPNSVTSIGIYAFYGCTSLTNVTIQNGVEEIGEGLFAECIGLKNIIIPDSVTKIGENVFRGCINLTSVTIPSSVKSIGYYVFNDCEDITLIICNNEYAIQYAKDHYIKYTISNDSIASTKVVLNKTSATIEKGKTLSLTVTLTPSNSTDKITWTSSDTKIATVSSSGVVKGVSVGIATITVKTSSGKTATCKVTVENSLLFKDVPANKWYYSTVKQVNDLGLMTGTTSTTFEPSSPTTRGMVATILHRMAGSPSVTYKKIFSDVPDGKYYSKAVTWAANNKVINGSNGKFMPGSNVTRQDMAVMICNYAKFKKINTSSNQSLTKFKDYKNVSSYAEASMKWCVEKGILSGTADGKLNPKANATRAECAKMLLQLYKLQ